jgi:large subunit ribosomal protein L10
MVQKAFNDAKSLAISQFILADGVVEDIIGRTYSQMLSLASNLSDDALSEDLREVLSSSAAVLAVSSDISETKKDEDDKKEPEAQEDSGTGLGALFG